MINELEWWVFLLVLPIFYWLLPKTFRRIGLTLASIALLAFYTTSDLVIMIVISGAVFVGFDMADGRLPKPIETLMRSPWPTVLVLSYFVWTKYLPTMGRILSGQESALNSVVPLGISYFSFKLLHYVIEMRRHAFPEHGIWDFFSWLFLAPTFTAGPIERFEHFITNRGDERFRREFIIEGGMRIAQGLVKKFLLGVLVLEAMQRVSGGGAIALIDNLSNMSPLMIWAFLLLNLTYVYLDFSAYSDIAIGSSKLFGITIMENFNFPFFASSLQEFWQRWHMTLASWVRSYIYISMIGLTRNPYYAVIASFVVMGLWHAAEPYWIAWGIWHGFGMAGALYWQRFAKKRKITFFRTRGGIIVGWGLTMGFVALGGTFTLYYNQAPFTDSIRVFSAALGVTW